MKRNLNNYNHARKVPSSRTLPSFDSSSSSSSASSSSSSSSSFCSLVPSFPPSSSFSVRASCAVRTMEIPAENDSVVSLGGHFDSLIVAASPSLSSSSSSNYGSSSSSSESSLFLSSKPARVKGFGSAIDRSTAVSSENALSDSSSSKKRGDVSPPSSSSSSSFSCESPCSPSSISSSSSCCSAPIWIRDPHKMKINKDLPYAARRSNNHSPSFLERKSQFLEEDADVDDLDVMEIPSRSLNSSSSSSSSSPASWWRGYEWGSARSIVSDNGDQEGLFLCDEDLQDHDCEPAPLSL